MVPKFAKKYKKCCRSVKTNKKKEIYFPLKNDVKIGIGIRSVCNRKYNKKGQFIKKCKKGHIFFLRK